MDFDYAPEDEHFRSEIRTWLAEHLVGDFAQLVGKAGSGNDEMYEERLAWERELHRGRWTGLGWPAEYGGRPASITQRLIFAYEYARARAPFRSGFQGTNLLGPTLIAHGTEAQKQRFLPEILAGREIWCQGFSEPNAGSDLANLRTRAELVGDEWVVNGQKIWTSHAHQADWIYVLARTNQQASPHRGISMLLIPMKQPGVEVRPIRNMADGDEFNEVFLTDARTSKDLVVGAVDGGWPIAMYTLEHERGTANMGYQMQFEAELATVADYAWQSGASADEGMRDRLAELIVESRVMRYDNLRLMSALMSRGKLGPESSLSKLVWPHWHQRLCELEMDLMGADAEIVQPGYGLNPFQRSFLVSRSESIYGGAHQIHLNIVGERILGLPRDPRPERAGAPTPAARPA